MNARLLVAANPLSTAVESKKEDMIQLPGYRGIGLKYIYKYIASQTNLTRPLLWCLMTPSPWFFGSTT